MHFLHVVGARPNFMKVSPVMRAIAQHGGVRQTLVHTGQHYDASMSETFFQQLGLPEPDINLGVGSASHATQTAEVMIGLEGYLIDARPDLVFVYGDVNSTMAAALVAAKLGTPLAHVEAGLRSGDRTMPEEINRLVTDRLSDLLLTPSMDANENLLHEGVKPASICFVGNVMIDTLVRLLPMTNEQATFHRLGLKPGERYALVTLHRPSNVDDALHLKALMAVLAELARHVRVIFPVHPRTQERLRDGDCASGPTLVEPLGYLEFLALERAATLVITDSGGIQEETTYLGVPCLTVRDNTERPITVTSGTNRLVGGDPIRLRDAALSIIAEGMPGGTRPSLWDGRAAERIAAIVCGTNRAASVGA
jgi:UDP-N-acetylglucosamine 2-epimerase (non-hydrolysing)